ncbi:MAG: HEAT repeat domain-containing protein, partial [Planctomycetota bacterium]
LAVGALGREADGAHLVGFATTDPRPMVRAAAVSALGDLGGEPARRIALATVLRPGFADPDWSLRATGMLALARCGRPEDVGRVLVAYREGRGETSWFARSALARLVAAKDTDPVPLLLRLVGDPDSRVAVTAAAGLGRSGHVEELLRLLSHVVPSIRAAAATGIAKARIDKGYGHLRALVRLDPSRKVRWAAALALFQVEDPLGDELVTSAVEAREPAVWAEAIAQLAARTGERHGRDARAWRAAVLRWRARR